MTSVQLASICSRNLRQPDLSLMPASVLREVLVAINAALQEFYAQLPGAHKRTTVSEILRAPETVAYEFAARYAQQTLNTPFTASMRGCTVLIGDDPQPNEVVSNNAVLDGFMGQALTGNAVVYHDAVPLYDVIERATSAVRLYRSGACVHELKRCEDFRAKVRACGSPTHYYLEPCGSSQGADPEFLLRVHPMPDGDYKIRFEAELATIRVTFAQVQGAAVNLPVNDRFCESILLPLTEEKLLVSPAWADPTKAREIHNAADGARAALRLVPQDVGLPDNTVGTEEGF